MELSALRLPDSSVVWKQAQGSAEGSPNCMEVTGIVLKQAQGYLLHDPINTCVLCYNVPRICYPKGLRVEALKTEASLPPQGLAQYLAHSGTLWAQSEWLSKNMSLGSVQLELSSAPTLTGYLGSSPQIQERRIQSLAWDDGNWLPPLTLIHALFDFRDLEQGEIWVWWTAKTFPILRPSLHPCLW